MRSKRRFGIFLFPHNREAVKTLIAISLAVLIAGCKPPGPVSASGCVPGTTDEQIFSVGQARQYRLHVPPGYRPDNPVPLVLAFHGAGSTGAVFESYSGLSALADQAGYLVVYPQGLGDLSNWDTMPNSRDVHFVRDLLDSLEARCSIDPKRVFATGHSRGGGMADRLGCELSDRLAAIGPISGDYASSADCSPTRPVAVVAFHGTLDPAIPYNGFGLPGEIHEVLHAHRNSHSCLGSHLGRTQRLQWYTLPIRPGRPDHRSVMERLPVRGGCAALYSPRWDARLAQY